MATAKRTACGFTLVELLVVITIVALLVALLLPSLAAARRMAQRAICAGNIRQFVLTCHVYSNDEKDAPPAGATYYGGSPTYFPYGRYCFSNVMRYHLATRYGLGNPGIWICAAGFDGNRHTVWRSYGSRYVTVNGTTLDNIQSLTTYGYLIGAGTPGGVGPTQVGHTRVLRLPETRKAHERIVWWDAIRPPVENRYGFAPWYVSVNNHFAGTTTQGGNYGFVDGHAAWREVRWGDNMTTSEDQYYADEP